MDKKIAKGYKFSNGELAWYFFKKQGNANF